MAKNPVFPLYYNDILGSCLTWDDDEFGAYIRLLIYQWDKKELPKDYQRLTKIATSLDKNWSLIKSKFEETETGLQNKVLEEIREKKRKHSENQTINVNKRYQNSTKPPTENLPLEDEIENENEKKKKKFVLPEITEIKKYFIELFSNEIEAEKFYNFYESKNWMIGKNKMKDWMAAARGWILRNETKPKTEKEKALNSGVADSNEAKVKELQLKRQQNS